jgi:putative peptidoglycan lipid II flippase
MELLQRRVLLSWRRLSSGTTNRSIFGAAVIVGGATAFVSLAYIVRELLLAASFGTTDALDAFLIAFSLPAFVVSVIGGSFASALIPTFIQVREHEGSTSAQQLVSGVMTLGVMLLIAATTALALVSSAVLPLLASGFDPAKLALTRQLFYLLLPMIVLNGLAMMWSALLNAGERFALAAFAPGIVPLAAVCGLLIRGQWGIQALAIGTICGFLLQLGFLGWGLKNQGTSLWPRWHGVDSAIRQAIRQYLPMLAATALLSSTLLVDQAFAATLEPGSVATFGYGTKLVTLFTGLGAGALGTAVLPYFSRMVAAADWCQVRQTIKTYRRLTLLASVPLTCVLFVFSQPIVGLIFQRGEFTGTDTALVSQVQALYALQIPFFALALLYARLLGPLGANHVLMRSAVISFPLNAVLDYQLSRIIGVAGIALATSLMYVASYCFLAIVVHSMLDRAELQDARVTG